MITDGVFIPVFLYFIFITSSIDLLLKSKYFCLQLIISSDTVITFNKKPKW